MIDEKDKMIVDAVNYLRCKSPEFNRLIGVDGISRATSENYFFDDGSYHFTISPIGLINWEPICTIKEYIQCTKEMSEAKWMQKPVEELMLSAREEAEIKAAKEKKVKDLAFVYGHWFKDDTNPEDFFSFMQSMDELSEIILPLEK